MTWLDTVIKVVLSIIPLLFIFGICFMLVSALWRRLRVCRERKHHISLHHKTNFRAFYYLAVEAPQQPALLFHLTAGNLPLVEVSQPEVEVKSSADSPAKAMAKSAAPAKTVGAASVQPAQQKLEAGVGQTVAKAGTLANILGALAGLIPGPLGEGARKQQEAIRQAQMASANAVQVPKQAQQRVMVLQSESRKLGVKPAAKQSAPTPASDPTSAPVAATVGAAAPRVEQVSGVDTSASSRLMPYPFNGCYCVQTVELDPGQTLPLTLMISPAMRQSLVGSFGYTLHLQAVPLEHFQEKVPVLSRRGMVHYAPVPVWRSFLPVFVNSLIFLFGLLGWFYLLTHIWS